MIDLKSMIKGCLAVSLAALAVLALFSRSVAFSYIGIDDAAYTFRNPFVASGFSVDNVVEAFANFRHGGIWMPITYISYMIDFSICKMLGIPLMQMLHLSNVLLHVVNFCLLIRFLRGLCVPASVRPFFSTAGGTQFIASESAFGRNKLRPSRATHDGEGVVATQDFGRAGARPSRAAHDDDTQMTQSINCQIQSEIGNREIVNNKFLLFIVFAALIWAIHPLRVEPVAWVAARKELLWTMFSLLGLLSWMRFCSSRNKSLGQPSGATAATTGGTQFIASESAFGRNKLRPSRATHDGDTQMTKSPNDQIQSEIANRKIVNNKGFAYLTVFFCILACLSKPTAMCFPFLALLVDWRVSRKPNAIGNRKSKITAYILMFLVAGATAAVAAYSQTHVAGQDVTSLYATPLPQRLVNAFSAIGFYLRATIWPFGLHIDCRTVKSLMPLEGWLNLSVFAVACAVCLWSAFRGWRNASNRISEMWLSSNTTTTGASSLRHATAGRTQFIASESAFGRAEARPSRATHECDTQMTQSPNGSMQSEIVNRKSQITDVITFSILWFIVGLLPTLGIFGGFGIEAHADRFAYLPSMGISFLCAALLAHVGDLERLAGAGCPSRSGIALKWAGAAVVLAFAVASFRQLGFWRDDATAYKRVLVCDQVHPRAMVHVADSLCSRRRDFAGGIAMYRKALSLADTVPDGGFNVADVRARLAYALASRGGYDDFGEVKRLGADVLKDVRLDRRGMMLDALGTAFMQEGDYRLAAILFTASLNAPDRFWPKASTQHKLDMCKGGF